MTQDPAAIIARAVLQIIAGHIREAEEEVASYVRDEYADLARQILNNSTAAEALTAADADTAPDDPRSSNPEIPLFDESSHSARNSAHTCSSRSSCLSVSRARKATGL